MFKKAMRNISYCKGHYILIGILVLIFSALSCIALTIRETAAKAAGMGSSGQRFGAQGFSPFQNASHDAGIALLILLSVGVILFIVLTVLNVRKRRSEICTLNAIGMKKGKIALQFATEIVAVTMAFAVIGTAVGYFVSAPAANAFLRYQLSSESQQMRNSGNWQQNGNQYNQGDGNSSRSTNGNTNGNRANNKQSNSSQANAKQTADNQTNGNQANNNQANNDQANGNQAGGNNQGSGNSGWGNSGSGRNFGQGQRSSSGSSMRGFLASPDIFVLLETLGIGLGFAILSSCAAAVAVSNCEPMKIMNPKRG